jgi:hypothetical protein
MTAHRQQHEEIAIRRLGPGDTADLDRLAQRDSAEAPSGSVLGALVDGRLMAAVSLESGDAVSDPFLPSAEARALLAERAVQLRGRGRGANGHRLLALVRRRPARTRGALGASPPGAGGRLLRLN